MPIVCVCMRVCDCVYVCVYITVCVCVCLLSQWTYNKSIDLFGANSHLNQS